MCPVWKRTLPPSCTCRVTGTAADVANISASNVIPLVFALPLSPDFKRSPKDQIGERFVILHSLFFYLKRSPTNQIGERVVMYSIFCGLLPSLERSDPVEILHSSRPYQPRQSGSGVLLE